MQDARPGLRGTIVTELPAISAFCTRAYRGISREGTLFFGRPEIKKTCSRQRECVKHRLSSYLGALTWVSTGEGSEQGNHSSPCLWHMLTLEERR